MSKLNGIILALALWLAFCGMASATQLYVNESGWWRGACAFNASGTPIQGAVGAAAAGDSIYVHGGNYYENVDVDKPRLTLEGEGADVVTVTAADAGDHVFEMTVDYANISGFAVRGATDNDMAGIRLTNVDYCNISENNVYGNHRSIYLFSSSDNTLTNNTANSNDDYGIFLQSSSNNTLTNNTANSNAYGGIMLSSSSNNTLTSNTANSNNHYGIYIVHSNNNMFSNNTASDNYRGIRLHSSSSNTLTSNTANSNNCDGIYLPSSSNNNTLTSNNASNNCYAGIYLLASSCTLANNTANSNNYGIYLYNADDNNITCNLVQGNGQGFYLTSGSTGNNISCNNIIENGGYNATSGGWEWQFYINQYNPVEAKHNYWGAEMNNTTIDASIYDDEEGWGEVEFYPFETEPVPCAPDPDRVSSPNITSYSPETPVSDEPNATRMFNITVNQIVNVTWLINGTIVHDANTSVTTASYTNTSAAAGVWNVSAVVSNANGTDMQTWIWNVAPRVPGDVTGDDVVNISDAVLLFNWVSFPNERGGAYALNKSENADVTGNGVVNIGDAVLLFNWVSFPDEQGKTYVLK